MIRKNNRLWNRLKQYKIRIQLKWQGAFLTRYKDFPQVFLEIINRQLKEQLLDLP
jgi:hypothetical protein